MTLAVLNLLFLFGDHCRQMEDSVMKNMHTAYMHRLTACSLIKNSSLHCVHLAAIPFVQTIPPTIIHQFSFDHHFVAACLSFLPLFLAEKPNIMKCFLSPRSSLGRIPVNVRPCVAIPRVTQIPPVHCDLWASPLGFLTQFVLRRHLYSPAFVYPSTGQILSSATTVTVRCVALRSISLSQRRTTVPDIQRDKDSESKKIPYVFLGLFTPLQGDCGKRALLPQFHKSPNDYKPSPAKRNAKG